VLIGDDFFFCAFLGRFCTFFPRFCSFFLGFVHFLWSFVDFSMGFVHLDIIWKISINWHDLFQKIPDISLVDIIFFFGQTLRKKERMETKFD
jgi:hypothetical protein